MKTAIVDQWLAAAAAGEVENTESAIIGIEAVPGHEKRVEQYLQQLGTMRIAVLLKGYLVCELPRRKVDAVAAFPGVRRLLPIEDLCDVRALAERPDECKEEFASGDLVGIVNLASAQVVGFLRDWDGERGIVDLALFGRAIPLRVTRAAIKHVPLPEQWA